MRDLIAILRLVVKLLVSILPNIRPVMARVRDVATTLCGEQPLEVEEETVSKTTHQAQNFIKWVEE